MPSPFHILATGPWRPGSVHLHPTPSTRLLLPQIEQTINHLWTQGLSQTPLLFDGPMCRLESITPPSPSPELQPWDPPPPNITLHISPTSYKIFFGTNLHQPHLFPQYGPTPLANPIGLSAAVLTSDHYLLLGQRNSSVAYYPNRIHPFAGSLEPSDPDPFSAIQRELHEELSLPPNDLHNLTLLGILEDAHLHQPELIFQVSVPQTLATLRSQLDPTEHHSIHPIPLSSLPQSLSNPHLTPVAQGTLSLLLPSYLNPEP
ncbi:MAG TPA: NUDIX hydrolase [Tepidisphaeraceae bacterium]|nr:NUDIX hydrolase [Tepidisphaeraceae bacterium]